MYIRDQSITHMVYIWNFTYLLSYCYREARSFSNLNSKNFSRNMKGYIRWLIELYSCMKMVLRVDILYLKLAPIEVYLIESLKY
jgi:hypothetical protein